MSQEPKSGLTGSRDRLRTGPPLLLINPWIYDFAAYDFFARPLGLLYLAGVLEAQGYQVHLLDCLGAPHAQAGPWGSGRLPKKILPSPPLLKDVRRHYGRYGLSEAACREQLSRTPPPAAILVTSLMTYWYPGVAAAIRLAREYFPGVPVILGGIYATLCPEHARAHSGADLVLPGPGEGAILSILEEGWQKRNFSSKGTLRKKFPSPLRGEGQGGGGEAVIPPSDHLPPGEGEKVAPGLSATRASKGICQGRTAMADLDSLPYPALHLLPQATFIPILTSRGCPLECSYCASHLLQPCYRRRRPQAVAQELGYWQGRLGLKDVAFYDDALLVAAEEHLLPILEELARGGLSFRFHTPNGLHARLVTPEVARGLKKGGFITLRLGVETTALGAGRLDRKLATGELEAALACLQEAGFAREQLGVYLLLGLPGQEEAELAAAIIRVKALGATPILAQYSPIPGTALWPRAVECSRYDLAADPLCHNNSLFPCWPQFSWDTYTRLKRLACS